MLLEAKNISKKYNNQPVISDFSFTIDSGDIVVLTGRSGTGKTTLMRILNNLETADSGSLKIEDTPLFEQTERGATYV